MRRIITETGSRYLYDDEAGTLTREEVGVESVSLRRDNEAVKAVAINVAVGDRATFALEPLSPDSDVTIRITSPVVSIEEL